MKQLIHCQNNHSNPFREEYLKQLKSRSTVKIRNAGCTVKQSTTQRTTSWRNFKQKWCFIFKICKNH